MLTFFSTLLSNVYASECGVVEPIPEAIQVAWVSPVGVTVRSNQAIEVVHLQSMQTWISTQDATPTELLKQLGMVSERASDVNSAKYKVTIFDVESNSLCRPIQVSEGDELQVAGLAVCSEKKTKPSQLYTRFGYTGCGYTKNSSTSDRGFDVYRVTWKEASKWGFCVLPLERFLLGAPR